MNAIPQTSLLLKRIFSKADGRKPFQALNAENYTIRCSALSAAERGAFDDGQLSRGKVLSILKNACSWRELPEDVTEAEIAFFAEIVDEIDDPWLKAHLAHLVWHYQSSRNIPRNIKLALDAIDSYRSISLNAKNMVRANNFWNRAIGLALSIKNNDRLSAIEDDIIQIFESATCERKYFGRDLANLLKSNKRGKSRATAIATKLESMALGFESDNEHSVAADYYQAAADWFESAGDTTKFVEMLLRKAESFVKKGDDRLSSEKPSCLVAALSYGAAIDTLYWLKEKSNIPKSELSTYQVNERIDELMLRQEELLNQGISEIEPIRVDITERVNQRSEIACAAVTGKGHIEALYKFVNLRSMVDIDKLALEYYRIYVPYFAKAALLPALEVIRQEHCLEPELFFSIVEHSPLVESERTQTFGKGLIKGYNGNFDEAFRDLYPQIEHLIRSHLKQCGINTRKRKNGIEEQTLSWLLRHNKTEEIFEKNLLFELRTLFLPHRNDHAHGLIDDTSSPSPCDVYIWWLMLRLVFNSSNLQPERE